MRTGLVIAALAMLTACDPAPNSAPAKGETASEANTLTLAKFNQLQTGMSIAEVEAILGFAGTEQSSNEIGGTKTVMLAWANPNGLENMNAMFQNGKMISKAQFMLK